MLQPVVDGLEFKAVREANFPGNGSEEIPISPEHAALLPPPTPVLGFLSASFALSAVQRNRPTRRLTFPDKIIFTIRKPGSQEKNTPSEMHYSPLLDSWIPYRKYMKFNEFTFVHLLTFLLPSRQGKQGFRFLWPNPQSVADRLPSCVHAPTDWSRAARYIPPESREKDRMDFSPEAHG